MSKALANNERWSLQLLLILVATMFLLLSSANAATLPNLNWVQRTDWVNVKTAYGAVGNGTTDEYHRHSIGSDPRYRRGKPFISRRETYKVSSTLTLAGASGLFGFVLMGNGSATTLSWYGATGGDFFHIDGNPYGRYERVSNWMDAALRPTGSIIMDVPLFLKRKSVTKHMGFYNSHRLRRLGRHSPGRRRQCRNEPRKLYFRPLHNLRIEYQWIQRI